jgi:hypothetical protein
MRNSSRIQRPRELRRRVVLRARIRHGAAWSDACILNLSSRGLLIHTRRPAPAGTEIELRRGEHMIVARVMWRDGSKAGLQADDRLPVEDIMTFGQSQALQLTAGGEPFERRVQPRLEDPHRWRARALEFAGVIMVGASLASAAVLLVGEAFAKPLAAVQAALGG